MTVPEARILSIGTALPPHCATQDEVLAFMERLALASLQRELGAEPGAIAAGRLHRTMQRIYAGSAIRQRHSVLGDYTRRSADFEFYPANPEMEPFPSTARRMEVYAREAPGLAERAARECLKRAGVDARAVTQLVVVSCTGCIAPGPDIALVRSLGLNPGVERTAVGFMGCYAAFNGLRLARAACRAEPSSVALVVCVELCSLHFQRQVDRNNIVANCLFADGAAAALVSADPRLGTAGGLAMVDSCTVLHDHPRDLLAWRITDTGFQMTVDPDVPEVLMLGARALLTTLAERQGVGVSEIDFWAIHPGGRRIITILEEGLGLGPEDVEPALEVLANYGNMSSPTILFVLERCLQRAPRSGALGLALGFGPGLTCEALLLRQL